MLTRRPRRSLRSLLAAATVLTGTAALTLPTPTTADAAPGDVVLSEDFSSGTLPDGFTPVLGDWSVQDGRLVGDAVDGYSPSRLTFGPHLDNYRIDATVRFDSRDNASRWGGFILDVAPDGSAPWWHAIMRSTSTASNGIEIAERTAANGWNVPYATGAPTDAGVGRDVQVSITVQDRAVTWTYDGEEVLQGRIGRSDAGVLGIVAAGVTMSIDDLRVTELAPDTPVADDGELPATIAHRGYSSVAPENTLAAVASGVRSGAEYVEVDVHTTADGVPVIMHDQTVDRTTDGSGDVSRLTAGSLAGLDAGAWFAPGFAGQPVPTLDDVLDAMDGTGATLLLEIKGPESDAEVERIVDAVVDAGMADQVVVQSFSVAALESARAHAPDLPRALLRGSLDGDPVAVARDLGVVAYNPNASALTARPGVVADLNAAGIAVMPYTVNSADAWQALTDMGVDGIITDRPAAFIGWKQRVAQGGQDPAPATPTATVVAPVDGVEVERGDDVVVAVSTTDADQLEVTLDGVEVGPASSIPAAELGLGDHVVEVTATGPGGEATTRASFTVVVTVEGLRARLAAVELAPGHRQQLLTALEDEDWDRLRDRVEQFVTDEATAADLLVDVDALAG